jgi:cytochrome c peroxidase
MKRLTSYTEKLNGALLVAAVLWGFGFMPGSGQAQTMTINCPDPGFGEVAAPPVPGILPFVPMTTLKTTANPVIPGWPSAPALRGDLAAYVVNLNAAIRLGKALFWDMQAGSDNKTACASCHFHAGADSRARNQLNPGANKAWDADAPNYTLLPTDFPFFISPQADTDSIAGSQGVRLSTFKGFNRTGGESTTAVADPVFNVGGVNVRQVTALNSPSAINSVFNHRQFWNGRAQPEFNGVNPFGSRDTSARVWMLDPRGTPVKIDIRIANASLASQAVGPPLSTSEMSAIGRTFPDLGRKMLLIKPLGLQKVSPTDSVLGPVADPVKGLTVSYKTMIQQAFQAKWWNSKKNVSVDGQSYTMMEANFSMFWGLSLMLYQATLVSDDTPMDQYLASRVFDLNTGLVSSHNPSWLEPVAARLQSEFPGITKEDILRGLELFEKPVAIGADGLPVMPPPPGSGVGCNLCHVGAETTSASIQNLAGHGLEPGDIVFKNAGFDLRLERMFMTFPPVPTGTMSITYDPSSYTVVPLNQYPAEIAVYDAGWYNVGARPTADDLGVGGVDPFGKPLSWTELFQKTLVDPGSIAVPGGGLGCFASPPAAAATSPFAGEVLNPFTGLPLLAGPLRRNESTDVPGSFKTPGLRNVELTGPYLHNGGKSTLLQAVEFYDDGGNFPENPTLSPLIRPLGMTPEQVNSLVAFMVALTDERVRWEKAPFDHPELIVPNGQAANGTDITITLPAVGAAGAATPLQRFLGLNPFTP